MPSFVFALTLLSGPSWSQTSVADTLRNSTKKISASELPDTYRAVSFGQGQDAIYGYSMLSMLSVRGGGQPDQEQTTMLLSLISTSFVDPDEFAALLDGKMSRIRAYQIDLTAMAAKSSQPGNSSQIPDPIFTEMWIESGRIVQWIPKGDVTKAAIVKAFGGGGAEKSEGSAQSTTISNAKQVAIGIMLYSGDYDDKFPAANGTAEAQTIVMPYLKNGSIWKSLNPSGSRLLYNTSLSRKEMTSLDRPADTLLLWDENPWPDGGRVVGYADGHVKYVTKEQWGVSWANELRRRKEGSPRRKVRNLSNT